jgi:hypothetical protein
VKVKQKKYTLKESKKIFKEDWERTAASRFRKETDISHPVLINYATLHLGQGDIVDDKFAAYVGVTGDYQGLMRNLRRVEKSMPKMFCINEELSIESSPKIQSMIKKFYLNYFPNPSSYEM